MTAYENKISRQTAPNLGILVGCAGNIRQEDKKRIRRVLKSLPYKEFELEEIENSSLYVASYAQEKSAFKKGKLGTWGRIGRNTNSYAALFQEEKTSKLTLQVDKIGNKGWFYTAKKDRLFFSTDLRVLSDISEENTINPSAILQYFLLNYPLLPNTYFKNIFQLEYGHSLTWHIDTGLETHKEQPNSVLADADYFDLLKVSIEELIAYPEHTAFHLSGGIDSSLLLHLAAEFEETLTAFTAYYSPDHADLKYSRLVAKETEANLLEVKIGDGQVLESSKHLRFISGGPVMAMGIPTFDIMSRTAKQHGITHLISGIGGDHLFTGHLKRAAIDKCGFFESIVNVDIQRVKWAFDPDVFEKIVSKLKEQVLAKVHQDLSIEEQVELFYREHFVKEHFRMSNIAHMKHGIVLSSPFWNLDLITLGLNRTTDRSDFSEKGFLRDELKKRKSIAAQRYHKQQMTLDLKHWQQAVRSELNSILTKNEPVIEGIRKEFIQELLAPNRPYNKSEFRLLWVLFNLYGWLKDLNINRFSLYEI